MSSRSLQSPSLTDGSVKTALQDVSPERRSLGPQADGHNDHDASTNSAEEIEKLSNNEARQMMEFVGNLQRIVQKMTEQPLYVEMPELRVRGLQAQADILESDFDFSGTVECIEKTVECRGQALSLTPNGHSERAYQLGTMGRSLSRKFERFGNLADINEAIECLSQAMPLTPDWHPNRLAVLNNLGISYMGRFELVGELVDVDKALECMSQALLLTPDGHADKPGRHNNLGNSYARRFQRLGELGDIDRAIECLSQAVLLTPDGHTHKPGMHSNLGNSYRYRFQRLGELADIDRAIECLSQAVLLTSDGHADKPGMHNDLGKSYVRRFERLGELADIERAIECLSQAVLLTPDGHVHKPGMHNNLGGSYLSRFQRLGELADIERAIECLSQAVLLTPDGHVDMPGMHSNLGTSYQCRFERLGELADIERAIECLSQAVLLTPDAHTQKPDMHKALGIAYDSRFKTTCNITDLQLAHSNFQLGACLSVLAPNAQLACARKWAKSSTQLSLSSTPAYNRCMELVPHVVWLGATIDQRYTLLTSITDLATEAAAWAISVHCHDLALEWLEAGRSIVWNQILQLRTPFDDLYAVAPSLATRLKDVALQLESAGPRKAVQVSFKVANPGIEEEAQHHRRLATEWEQLLDEVRKLPGFQTFMRPLKATELKLAATDGPVIVINTHSSRCDALIIFPQCDDIAHIPLIQFPSSEAPVRLPESVTGHRGESIRKFGRVKHDSTPEDPFKTELTALWLIIVEPILDALACSHTSPVDELPHVTWCVTGPLAFVPIHAAGTYNGSSPNTFDLVVSSYTPSLSALLASGTPQTTPASGLLAVGQKYTKGFSSLPNTVQELAVIKAHAQAAGFVQLDDENATATAVLNQMAEQSWVHLACHATQDENIPAQSAFHLYDGKLTLEAITKRQFKNKGLAFLSACETAKGDGKLPDEAVHLAAGMLMAGYPSVIATMWSIADADGPEVAGRVYAELLNGGKMDHKGAARALHKAVAELREKLGVEQLRRWVPFIHIGV